MSGRPSFPLAWYVAAHELFAPNPTDPVSVRGALLRFDEAVSNREVRPSVSARVIAQQLTTLLKIKNVPDHSVYPDHEKRRAEALCRALVSIGHKLDTQEMIGLPPSYHNKAHNLLVMATRLVRGLAGNVSYADGPSMNRLITEMRDLVAALGHDLGHDGTTNRSSGSYIPAQLEMSSYGMMEPLLIEAGVCEKDRTFIKNIILATDPNLPGDILQESLGAHKLIETPTISPDKLAATLAALSKEQQAAMLSLQKALRSDKALAVSASVLKGCDMVPSYGLGAGSWTRQTRLFDLESRASTGMAAVDEKGQPLPDRQLFVMWHFVGAAIESAETTKPPSAPLTIRARFADPMLDHLFGGSLREIENSCLNQLAPNFRDPIQKGILRKAGLEGPSLQDENALR